MIDWDDAFDNSSYVAGSDQLAERWSEAAAAFRDEQLAQGSAAIDLRNGPLELTRLDLFLPVSDCIGLIVFIHGGYWHLLDKSYWSHLAQAAVAAGWAVAIPGYTLAPAARIHEITREIGNAIEFVASEVAGPLRLIGHSAGGHLVARMVCEDSALPVSIRSRLHKVIPVSGVFDLRPLILTRMNETLRLTADEARSESPVIHVPLRGIDISCWVGAAERPEFLRQTRMITETWQSFEAKVQDYYEPGKNHFSVIESMASENTALFRELTT